MTIHPMLLAQSAQYRQEELRGLGGHHLGGHPPGGEHLGGHPFRGRPRSRSPRVWRRPRLRFLIPPTLHPRPASSR